MVLKLDPKASTGYRYRAQANVAKRNLRAALVDCEMYLKANPRDNNAAQFRDKVLADLQRADKEIAQGYAAGQQAPEVKLKHELQTFSFGSHSFDLLPPENFSMKEMNGHPHMKAFVFIGPEQSGEKPPLLEVMIITAAPRESGQNAQKLLDSIINPYRQHLSAYLEESNKSMIVSGLTFQGSYFSGAYGGVNPVRGCVFVAQEKDILYVILAQSDAKSFDDVMKVFVDSLKTCKFHELK